MTAVIRRWTRCRKPNNLSDRLAAVWGYRSKNLGAVQSDLLVQDQFRKMVALAILLVGSSQTISALKVAEIAYLNHRSHWKGRSKKK